MKANTDTDSLIESKSVGSELITIKNWNIIPRDGQTKRLEGE